MRTQYLAALIIFTVFVVFAKQVDADQCFSLEEFIENPSQNDFLTPCTLYAKALAYSHEGKVEELAALYDELTHDLELMVFWLRQLQFSLLEIKIDDGRPFADEAEALSSDFWMSYISIMDESVSSEDLSTLLLGNIALQHRYLGGPDLQKMWVEVSPEGDTRVEFHRSVSMCIWRYYYPGADITQLWDSRLIRDCVRGKIYGWL